MTLAGWQRHVDIAFSLGDARLKDLQLMDRLDKHGDQVEHHLANDPQFRGRGFVVPEDRQVVQ